MLALQIKFMLVFAEGPFFNQRVPSNCYNSVMDMVEKKQNGATPINMLKRTKAEVYI